MSPSGQGNRPSSKRWALALISPALKRIRYETSFFPAEMQGLPPLRPTHSNTGMCQASGCSIRIEELCEIYENSISAVLSFSSLIPKAAHPRLSAHWAGSHRS